ncbi:DJ-1/PfpI family protein [Alicyclobacillus ferrooxydans]|uniref:DJ-1/PfpI domain-containing protein n=1 Tax=Alicyclobacillus ferrooxydans TaxID=471514 RepID=A0A0P9EWB1_9BACL|nr:DJ-1/PfpI family protein [Alicyclobacillus ferrooxydans]KPV43345.1 hypothetical protein AN477_12900 [Alicyclobacillus ferrooxydans]
MKAAFLALPNCEIWQVATLQRLLTERGWSMRTLTIGGQTVCTDGGVRLVPDGDVYNTFPGDFGLLVVAGGTITEQDTRDPSLMRFLRQYDVSGGAIACIGSGAAIVGAAGLLGGLHTAVDSDVVQAFPDAFNHAILTDELVALDGSVTTAHRDAYELFGEVTLELTETYHLARRKQP